MGISASNLLLQCGGLAAHLVGCLMPEEAGEGKLKALPTGPCSEFLYTGTSKRLCYLILYPLLLELRLICL